MKLARSFNEAVAVHIIGDRGAEQIIPLLEKHPAPGGKRDRLIHACILREDLVEIIAKLPVVVDIQPYLFRLTSHGSSIDWEKIVLTMRMHGKRY